VNSRIVEVELSLRGERLRHKEPIFSAVNNGRHLKIKNPNGSSFVIAMPRGDSPLIEGLAARKIALLVEDEIRRMDQASMAVCSSDRRNLSCHRLKLSSLNDGLLLKVTHDEGKASFVIAMPDGLSPVIEALAFRQGGNKSLTC